MATRSSRRSTEQQLNVNTLEGKNIAQLQVECDKLNLDTSGSKQVLIDRIRSLLLDGYREPKQEIPEIIIPEVIPIKQDQIFDFDEVIVQFNELAKLLEERRSNFNSTASVDAVVGDVAEEIQEEQPPPKRSRRSVKSADKQADLVQVKESTASFFPDQAYISEICETLPETLAHPDESENVPETEIHLTELLQQPNTLSDALAQQKVRKARTSREKRDTNSLKKKPDAELEAGFMLQNETAVTEPSTIDETIAAIAHFTATDSVEHEASAPKIDAEVPSKPKKTLADIRASVLRKRVRHKSKENHSSSELIAAEFELPQLQPETDEFSNKDPELSISQDSVPNLLPVADSSSSFSERPVPVTKPVSSELQSKTGEKPKRKRSSSRQSEQKSPPDVVIQKEAEVSSEVRRSRREKTRTLVSLLSRSQQKSHQKRTTATVSPTKETKGQTAKETTETEPVNAQNQDKAEVSSEALQKRSRREKSQSIDSLISGNQRRSIEKPSITATKPNEADRSKSKELDKEERRKKKKEKKLLLNDPSITKSAEESADVQSSIASTEQQKSAESERSSKSKSHTPPPSNWDQVKQQKSGQKQLSQPAAEDTPAKQRDYVTEQPRIKSPSMLSKRSGEHVGSVETRPKTPPPKKTPLDDKLTREEVFRRQKEAQERRKAEERRRAEEREKQRQEEKAKRAEKLKAALAQHQQDEISRMLDMAVTPKDPKKDKKKAEKTVVESIKVVSNASDSQISKSAGPKPVKGVPPPPPGAPPLRSAPKTTLSSAARAPFAAAPGSGVARTPFGTVFTAGPTPPVASSVPLPNTMGLPAAVAQAVRQTYSHQPPQPSVANIPLPVVPPPPSRMPPPGLRREPARLSAGSSAPSAPPPPPLPSAKDPRVSKRTEPVIEKAILKEPEKTVSEAPKHTQVEKSKSPVELSAPEPEEDFPLPTASLADNAPATPAPGSIYSEAALSARRSSVLEYDPLKPEAPEFLNNNGKRGEQSRVKTEQPDYDDILALKQTLDEVIEIWSSEDESEDSDSSTTTVSSGEESEPDEEVQEMRKSLDAAVEGVVSHESLPPPASATSAPPSHSAAPVIPPVSVSTLVSVPPPDLTRPPPPRVDVSRPPPPIGPPPTAIGPPANFPSPALQSPAAQNSALSSIAAPPPSVSVQLAVPDKSNAQMTSQSVVATISTQTPSSSINSIAPLVVSAPPITTQPVSVPITIGAAAVSAPFSPVRTVAPMSVESIPVRDTPITLEDTPVTINADTPTNSSATASGTKTSPLITNKSCDKLSEDNSAGVDDVPEEPPKSPISDTESEPANTIAIDGVHFPIETDDETKKKEETEPELDENHVQLDSYNSDLHIKVTHSDRSIAEPLTQDGFALMWAGIKASYGVIKGKIGFQVRIKKFLATPHLTTEDTFPHDLRVGWSVLDAPYLLGEAPYSYGLSSLGLLCQNREFTNFGNPSESSYDRKDIITCLLDYDEECRGKISYWKNKTDLGIAFEFQLPKELRPEGNAVPAIFPHICTKNSRFEVNFGQGDQTSWLPMPDGYRFIDSVGVSELERAYKPPESKNDCTVLMMVGLPGAGKTYWVNEYLEDHPEERWEVIGTDTVLDCMRVDGQPRHICHNGRWDMLMGMTAKSVNKLLQLACRRKKNYIIDQTNVTVNARKRKMTPFKDFGRKAVVIIPGPEEFANRMHRQNQETRKEIPSEALLELKASFSLPTVADGYFDDIHFIEPQDVESAQPLVTRYNEEGKAWQPRFDRRRRNEGYGGQGNYRRNRDRTSRNDSIREDESESVPPTVPLHIDTDRRSQSNSSGAPSSDVTPTDDSPASPNWKERAAAVTDSSGAPPSQTEVVSNWSKPGWTQ